MRLNRLMPSVAGIAGLLLAVGLGLPTIVVRAQEPTPTPEPEASGSFEVLGISPTLCLVFTTTNPKATGVDPIQCGQMDFPASLARLEQLHGDADGRIEPADFAGMDLDGNQVHQKDDAPSENGSIFVLAFVHDDDPVQFSTTRGVFMPAGSVPPGGFQPPGIDPVDDDWLCDKQSEDEDCDGDGVAGDGVVVVRLRARYGTKMAERGEGAVTIRQGTDEARMRFRVVGEPDSVEFLTLESTIQNGVRDLDGDGELGSKGECPLETTAAGFLAANATPERAIVLGIVRDEDGAAITNAFLLWDTDDNDKAVMAAPLTPTLDLGAFGFGAPNLICGTNKPGKVRVLADISRTQQRGGVGAVLDPQAELDSGTFEFTVRGLPASIELKAEPQSLACDGRASSKVSATVRDGNGDPVAAGTKVRFDVRVLGTASPINATTGPDGVASSTVTPLAGGTAGVPVVVTAGGVQASILVSCAAGAPPAGEVAPPPAAPAPTPEGAVAPSVRQPGLPRSGTGLRPASRSDEVTMALLTIAVAAGCAGGVAYAVRGVAGRRAE